MRTSDLEKFSNSFLLLDGDQAVVRSYGPQDRERAKRPHTKSRNGCMACKRRRVKCDERLPCRNCINRHEKCEKPNPRPLAVRSQLPQQPATSSHVNKLHIELFYHFTKVTQYTLTFSEIWETQLQESFKYDYLLHAILAISAKHMSVLQPQDPQYAEAAIVLLNKSIQSFRENLDTPLTGETCEARLGTSILINYMAWMDLGFLDGQKIVADPEAGGLDMSRDLLFLLSAGVRQVFFTAIPIFREYDSPFVKVSEYHPCGHLQAEADKRGTNWRGIMKRLLNLFDDPDYQGCPSNVSSSGQQGSSPRHRTASPSTNNVGMDLDTSPGPNLEPQPARSASASPLTSEGPRRCKEERVTYDEHYLHRVIKRTDDSMRDGKMRLYSMTERNVWERISQRLAVPLSFIPEDGSEMEPLPEARYRDIERYFYFSFPTLCFGPILSLILDNDSRAVVLMYHTYRAANRLLRFEKTWWAAERGPMMEKLTLAELKARGLGVGI